MEKIVTRVRHKQPEDVVKELDDFVRSIEHLPTDEAEQRIAEDKFRKPIVIFNAIAIRPFWRDGREAPPLFPRIVKGDKALQLMSKGH